MVYYEDDEEPVDKDAPIEADEDDIDVDDIEGIDEDEEDDIEPIYGDEEERKTPAKWKKIESDEDDDSEKDESEDKTDKSENEEDKEEKVEESLKKDKYYVVVWDGHSDEDEDLGEYNNLKEAEQAAKDAVELDGYVVAEVHYKGELMRHFGLDESLKESRGKGFVCKYKDHSIIDAGDRYVITNKDGLNVGETKFGLPVIKDMIDDLVIEKNKPEESLDKKEPEIKLDEAAGTIKRKGFNLPSEITVSLDELDLDDIDDEDEVGEAISNYLSDGYGFTQYSFEWERGDNVEEINIDNIKWDISESLEEDLEEAAYQVMVMHQDYSETLHFLTAKSIEQLEYKIGKIDPHYIDYSIVSKEQEPAENKNEEDDLEECNKDLKECGPSKDDDLTESIAKGFVKSNFTEAKDMSGMSDEEKRQELARKSLQSLNESDEEVIDINDEELTEALGMPTEDQVKKEEPKKEEAKPEEVKEEKIEEKKGE